MTPRNSPDVLHVLASNVRRGAEVFGHSIAAELPGRQTIVALASTTDHPLPGVSVIGAPFPFGLLEVAPAARAHDVVLCHGSRALWAGPVAAHLGRRPWVYRSIGDPRHWVNTPARRRRVRAALGSASALLALWPQAADRWHDLLGPGGPEILVLPNATSRPLSFDAELAAHLHDWLARRPGPVIVVVASLTGEKRVADAVQAASSLRDAVLLVAGDGPDRAACERLAAALLPDRALFLGRVGDVAAVLDVADVLLLTSETEGQPGCVLEAAAAGVPAVCTAVGGVPSIVEDGVTGRLAALGNRAALLAALSDVLADRQGYGERAQRRWQLHYSLPAVAAGYAELLARVASAR